MPIPVNELEILYLKRNSDLLLELTAKVNFVRPIGVLLFVVHEIYYP